MMAECIGKSQSAIKCPLRRNRAAGDLEMLMTKFLEATFDSVLSRGQASSRNDQRKREKQAGHVLHERIPAAA